jgi:hypothetical protein
VRSALWRRLVGGKTLREGAAGGSSCLREITFVRVERSGVVTRGGSGR